MVLILLYSGWRISELLALRVEAIDLAAGLMRGWAKTKAGINRIVPIHSAIRPLIRTRCEVEKTFLFSAAGHKLYYNNIFYRFKEVMAQIGADHTIHETRHTFRSWLDKAGVGFACANRIMGHMCSDIGLNTYTHKTISELRHAIELIKVDGHKK